MKFDVLTLFPEMFEPMQLSILGRAIKQEIITLNLINFREFATDRFKHVDDTPYGGGAGMILKPQPIYDAYKSITEKLTYKPKVIYLSPRGKLFNQDKARELSKEKHIIFLCGHYEGVDQRIIDEIVDEEISIGDYVLTGGELPAMVVMDAISRNLQGVLNEESIEEESFSNGLLEYPQYTRPEIFMGRKVPEVLLSGHHANIEKWRKEQSIEITKKCRPDLIKEIKHNLDGDI